MHAATRGDVDIVKLLLEHEADVNARDRLGETALVKAMNAGHVPVVKLLLNHGARIEGAADVEQAKLMRAVKMRDVTAVRMLVEAGVDVNYACIEQYTPLMTACSTGSRSMVLELLKHGANVNQQLSSRDGQKNPSSPTCDTALAVAVCKGDVTIAKDLLMAGADVNLSCCVSDKNTTCTLVAAILAGDPHMVYLLLSHGANTDHCVCYGKMPLQLAISCGNIDVIKELLAFGANPNATFLDLPALCYADDAAMTKLLLSYGADPNLACMERYVKPPVKHSFVTLWPNSPLLFAIRQNKPRVVEAMLQHGLEPSCKTTALFHAIDWLNKDVVEQLIAYGADANTPESSLGCDDTAFDHAMRLYFCLELNHRDRLVDIIQCIIPLVDNFDPKVFSCSVPRCCKSCLKSVSSWYDTCSFLTLFRERNNQRLCCLLLQHGAQVKLEDVFGCVTIYEFSCTDLTSIITEQFLHLLVMTDEHFSGLREYIKALPSSLSLSHPRLAIFARRLSTPLSLQEIAIKRVRRSVGAPRLWHKIDSLPLPRLLKQACKLAA